MKRGDAQMFIDAILSIRSSATDEQALAAPGIYPAWTDGDIYSVGDRVLYDNVLYKVLQAHTAAEGWEPDVAPSLFAKVLIPDANVVPEWEQPDSTNGYMTGDKVTHNGATWVSDVDNNVWEPGVYGWTKVE